MFKIRLYLSNRKTHEHVVHLSMKYMNSSTNGDNYFQRKLTFILNLLITIFVYSEWKHASKRNISVATCNGSQIALAVGKELFCIEIETGNLKEVR